MAQQDTLPCSQQLKPAQLPGKKTDHLFWTNLDSCLGVKANHTAFESNYLDEEALLQVNESCKQDLKCKNEMLQSE